MRKTLLIVLLLYLVAFSNPGSTNPYDYTRQVSTQIISTDNQRVKNLCAYLINRAEHYQSQNLIDSSNSLLQRVLHLAGESGIPEKKMTALAILAENHRKSGNNEKALIYYEEFVRIKDFVNDHARDEEVERLNGLIEILEKELNEAQLYNELYTAANNELENTKLWLFYTWFIALLLLIIGSLYHLFRWRLLSDRISVAEEKFNQQNRALKKIIEEEEREKINIANELYNGLGKILSQAKLQVNLIEDILGKGKWQIVDDTIELVELAESKTKSLSMYLVPGELVQNGLIPAVNELIRNLKGKKKLDVLFRFEDYAIQPPIETEVTLYRIIHEIVGYAIKHPDVTRITISLKSSGTQISVIVTDNGKGFSMSDLEKEDEISWLNLNTRVHILNGALSIDSNDDEDGTQIKVELIS
jgi:two-component system, NarL family, sensor kinase